MTAQELEGLREALERASRPIREEAAMYESTAYCEGSEAAFKWVFVYLTAARAALTRGSKIGLDKPNVLGYYWSMEVVMSTKSAWLKPNVLRESKEQQEYRKANVLTYLKMAREHIGQAKLMLAPKTELWNQIHTLDFEFEDILCLILKGEYDDDSFGVYR